MTRKEALAVLFELQDAYIQALSLEAFREQQAFRNRVIDALFVLTKGVHGQPGTGQSIFLCDECHLHYAQWPPLGKLNPLFELCSSCSVQQKSNHASSEVQEVSS